MIVQGNKTCMTTFCSIHIHTNFTRHTYIESVLEQDEF